MQLLAVHLMIFHFSLSPKHVFIENRQLSGFSIHSHLFAEVGAMPLISVRTDMGLKTELDEPKLLHFCGL